MPRLTDMSRRIRTFIAFGLVLLVSIGLGTFSFYQLVAIDRASSELADKVMSSLFQSGQVLRMVINFRREEANRLLSLTAEDGLLREKLMQDYAEQATAIRSQYRPTTPDEQANIGQFDSLWPQFMESTRTILTKLNEGDRDAAREYYVNDNRVQFDAIHAALDKVLELTNLAGRRAYDAADKAIDQARLGVVIALVVATCIALGAGIATFVTTAFPIRRLTRAMERLSEH